MFSQPTRKYNLSSAQSTPLTSQALTGTSSDAVANPPKQPSNQCNIFANIGEGTLASVVYSERSSLLGNSASESQSQSASSGLLGAPKSTISHAVPKNFGIDGPRSPSRRTCGSFQPSINATTSTSSPLGSVFSPADIAISTGGLVTSQSLSSDMFSSTPGYNGEVQRFEEAGLRYYGSPDNFSKCSPTSRSAATNFSRSPTSYALSKNTKSAPKEVSSSFLGSPTAYALSESATKLAHPASESEFGAEPANTTGQKRAFGSSPFGSVDPQNKKSKVTPTVPRTTTPAANKTSKYTRPSTY